MKNSEIRDYYKDDSIADSYDADRFSSPIGRLFDAMEKRTLRQVVRRAVAGIASPAVLDAPCGTGRITEILLEEGLTVVGGDISPAMIAVAQQKCKRFGAAVSWRQVDLERLDIPDNSFDLVTCIRLFHHLETPDREAILRQLARVSRRYVLVNVAYSAAIYRMRRKLKLALGLETSRTSSTKEEILREASAAGLRLHSMTGIAPILSEDMILLFEKNAR
jgi:ubiquinone/menaquinone biosynthesis C-methylase UbiE